MSENNVIVKASPGKGMGMFACQEIPDGTEIYNTAHRLRMPREILETVLCTNTDATCKLLLSWGWGEGDEFVLPLGIEGFINHSTKPNMRNRRTMRFIQKGEELVENYFEFDSHEKWYVDLTEQYGAWIAPNL
jgi:hypothetical protein